VAEIFIMTHQLKSVFNTLMYDLNLKFGSLLEGMHTSYGHVTECYTRIFNNLGHWEVVIGFMRSAYDRLVDDYYEKIQDLFNDVDMTFYTLANCYAHRFPALLYKLRRVLDFRFHDLMLFFKDEMHKQDNVFGELEADLLSKSEH